MHHTNHPRLADRAGILVLAVLVTIAGCASTHSQSASRGKQVVLERGHTENNQPWKLVASEQSGHLSLSLEKPSGAAYSGSTGFSAAPGAGFWMEGHGPGGSIFYYGPAPTSAVKVQLRAPGHAPILIRTKLIPAQGGLPRGRYFIVAPPSTADVSWTVTLLNATGHKVAFADF
jgi:hypothetical protein